MLLLVLNQIFLHAYLILDLQLQNYIVFFFQINCHEKSLVIIDIYSF